MNGRLHRGWLTAGTLLAVVVPVAVLSLMQLRSSPEAVAVSESAELPGTTRDGPSPACCYDDADWRGEDAQPRYDFSDPAAGGIIPLMNVEGRSSERLSPNLRVGDLAARDGAPYARISIELVAALEDVITSTDAAIHVISGYRHPQRNALPEIGGASESQHMAGRAADISSPDLTPLELAGVVLDAIGCEIGLGLGETYVHMDVRGRRSLWVAEEGGLTREEFVRWVAERCGEEPFDDEDPEEGAFDPDELLVAFEPEMAEIARRLLDGGLDAGVALDLRQEEALVYAVLSGSAEALGLGLQDLIDTAAPGRYFAFAFIIDEDEVVRGFMRY